MLTASCPKCAKQVTVPTSAKPESRVRCPLCAEEYTLASIFAELPPLLLLLDVPTPNGTSGIHEEAPQGQAVVASASGAASSSSIFDFEEKEAEANKPADGSVAVLNASSIEPADIDEAAPHPSSFAFGDSPAPADGASAAAPRNIVRTPAKKKASPIKSLLGVVAGGLVALPLAQVVLWYLPGGWGIEQRDPVGIARNFPNSLGLLAPSWAKKEPVVVDDTAANNTPPTPPERPVDPLDRIATEGVGLIGDKPIVKPPQEGNDDNPEDEVEVDPATETGDGGDTTPVVEPPDDEPSTPPSPVKGAPTFTASDLAGELKAAKQAQGLIDTASNLESSGQERVASANNFMATMGKLAQVLTFATDRPAGHMEHVHELVATVSGAAKQREIIATIAARSVKPEAHQQGLLLVGTVRDVQPRGELFETKVELHDSKKRPVSVYGSQDPQGALAVGDTVVFLGVIVDEPNKNLAGYKGEPDPVVWGGYSQVVPVEE